MIKGAAPAAWHTLDAWKARRIEKLAMVESGQVERHEAAAEVLAIAQDRRARPVHGAMRDAEVKDMAAARAELMAQHITGMGAMARADWVARVGLIVGMLQGRPLVDEWQDLTSIIGRLSCAVWWGRQLKRAVVQDRERIGRETGEVCARRHQPYLTNDTVRRLLNRDANSRAMLEASEIETEAGEVITLAQAADASTANPTIRRGELMTRITGCEQWADARGWVGLFTTNTTPSRFHATTHTGVTNPKWVEAGKPTPKDGQAWLCKTWAQCRAAMARKGLDVFGVRVAEPHQDGTPHWHMLIWCKPGQREQVERVMRHYWLADEVEQAKAQRRRMTCTAVRLKTGRRLFGFCDLTEYGRPVVRYLKSGRRWTCKGCEAGWAAAKVPGLNLSAKGIEDGAGLHRFKAKAMDAGGAAGYVAKYISKGIDDRGAVSADGHHDERDGVRIVMEQESMFAGGAARVRMWARAHGIRQFQAIGQPPVTVWRELRRVAASDAEQAPEVIRQCWDAVNRDGERRASWGEYMERQGGACIGRGYRVRVATEDREQVGRYETTTQARPVGVADLFDDALQIVPSQRKEWRPKGTWARAVVPVDAMPVVVGRWNISRARALRARPQAAQPRTRVNNCTHERPHGRGFQVNGGADHRKSDHAERSEHANGGQHRPRLHP